jgi:hypothetical protein
MQDFSNKFLINALILSRKFYAIHPNMSTLYTRSDLKNKVRGCFATVQPPQNTPTCHF